MSTQKTRKRLKQGDARHGINGYTNYGCRCEICKDAGTEHQRRYRQQLRDADVPTNVHGTINGYQNYGCRCDECRAAAAKAKRDYKRRKAAA